MKFFYLSTTPNSEGKLEIHERNCIHKPSLIEAEYLGPFNNGKEALRSALLKNKKAATCSHCCTSTFSPSFVKSNSDPLDLNA
ncbi:hypothetical protein [Algoriphagus namhaensis]